MKKTQRLSFILLQENEFVTFMEYIKEEQKSENIFRLK